MKREKRRVFIMMIMAAMLMIIAGGANAQSNAIISTQAGYDETVFAARWYPLFVEVKAGDTDVKGTAYVDVNVNYEYADRYEVQVEVPAGETKRLHIPLRALTEQRSLQVTLVSGDQVVTDNAVVSRYIDGEAMVIGVLADEKTLTAALCAIDRRDIHGEREVIHAVLLDEYWNMIDERELQAFDALVISDANSAAEKQERLSAYEQSGGILIKRTAYASEDRVLQSAEAEMEALRILEAISQEKEKNADSRWSAGSRYSMSLNETMTVDDGNGLWSIAVFLFAYVLLVGAGLYAYMRKLDRSKVLWAAIPVFAGAAMLAVYAGGRLAGQFESMSTSVHIVHYDEENALYVEELVSLTAAGQAGIGVATKNNLPVERRETGYFVNAFDEETKRLRDILTIGEQPGIRLQGQAAWLVRSLVVHSETAPEGVLEASAWIDGEGLHALIENNTDQEIANALLLTSLGYAQVGDLKPGSSSEILLRRRDHILVDEKGNLVVEEGVMLAYAEGEFNVLRAFVDPERTKQADFLRSSLGKKEEERRNLLQSKYDLVSNAWGSGMTAMLIGELPGIPCETILVDGQTVSRTAQCSLLAKEIRIDTVLENGYYYYPSGTFKPRKVWQEADGILHLGELYEKSYTENSDDLIIGYRLEGVEPDSVHEIRFETMRYMSAMSDVTLEVYNHALGAWESAGKGSRIVIGKGIAQSAVGENGEFYIRYRNDSEVQVEQLSFPTMIIEGQKEGEMQ